MIKFTCKYVGWLVTVVVRVSADKVTAAKTAVKEVRLSIELAIFPLMNNTIDDDGNNLENEWMQYCITGGTRNNATKDQKPKKQGFKR